MRKNLISLTTILAVIAVILLISQHIFNTPEPLPDTQTIEKIFTLPVSDFKPEPNERKLFIISVLLIPFLCGFFYILLSRMKIVFSRKAKFYAQLLLTVMPLILIVLVDYSVNKYPFFALSSIKLYPLPNFLIVLLLFLILFADSYFNIKSPFTTRRLLTSVYYGIGLSLIGFVAAETIHNDTEPIVFIRNSFEHLHFMAYFDAIVQTYLGKSPIELNPQYGYYPFFLNPVFKIIGLTIIKFTIVMSFLKAISYLGMLVALRKSTENWLIALTGFITMLFYTRIRVPLDIGAEPYFQYNPHRLLFPALIIFLVWLYISQQDRLSRNIVYGLTSLVVSVSVLWNPDTGIVVFTSWLIVLGYIELLDIRKKGYLHLLRNIVMHTVINFSILGLVFLGIYLQTYGQTGIWPNLAENFQYTSLFYNYGFYMMPLPRELHLWLWVALTYIVGLFLSISHLLDVNGFGFPSVPNNKDTSLKAVMIFTISIIGTGVFLYYQGRSHNYNLVSISWPAYLLLTIFTDILFKNITTLTSRKSSLTTRVSLLARNSHQLLLFGALFYFLGASIPTLIIQFPKYIDFISNRLALINHTSQSLAQQSEFIRSTSTPDDTILILADEATELYLYTNHPRPLDIPGFGEMAVKSDFNKLESFLARHPATIKIYWDTSFRMVDPRMYNALTPTASDHGLILFESSDK